MRTITTFLRSLSAIAILILSAAAINAATFTVSNTNDTGAGSLRQAVTDSNTAAGSDTIVFDSSFSTARTITLTSGISVFPATGESLTINGPGANLLTISGGGTTRLFFRAATAHALSLSGMTLTMSNFSGIDNPNSGAQSSLTVTNVAFVSNVNDFGGGGISNGATLTVTGCTFTNNNTTTGGGSGSSGGGAILSSTNNVNIPVIISNSAFTGNMANSTFAGSGGAIRNRSGSMTITNSTFTNNTAINGGAVSSDENISITGSTFTGNSVNFAGSQGGAISGSGQLTINSSVITGNSAFRYGGGIMSNGNLTINNSTISNNNSNEQGGGIVFFGGATTLNITNSTVSGNTTRDAGGGLSAGFNTINITGSTFSNNSNSQLFGGGGISFNSNTATVSNSTFSGNTAAGQGGGAIRIDGGTLTFTSLTIANNTTTGSGGGILNFSAMINLRNSILANSNGSGGSPDIFGSVNSQGYNLIRSTMGATITGDTATNITGLDPQLGPLANNGGPTLTHALMVGSPAVDKGNSFGLTTDQRGMMRPSDLPNANYPNAAGGDGADIGAFEIQIATASGVTVSGRVFLSKGSRNAAVRAVVMMTDQSGQTRTAKPDALGSFSFAEVRAGETYIFNAYAKGYQFDTQVITVSENIDDLSFTPQR